MFHFMFRLMNNAENIRVRCSANVYLYKKFVTFLLLLPRIICVNGVINAFSEFNGFYYFFF